ncbi:MAG: hypothetical protein JWM11_5264 [Planctomycetaceae bacterium]|nr:hypothetical protein [Planctomycetaceae bacterium]
MPRLFEKRTRIPAPAGRVFDWHLKPGAFERLSAPWEKVTVVSREGGIEDGGTVILRIPLFGPLNKLWVSKHQGLVPGEQFQDVQLRGPFASLVHSHRVEPDGPDGCFLIDALQYVLPFGPLGALGSRFVQRKLQRMFDYRHRVTAADIAAQLSVPLGAGSMKVLVTGSTGLVGSALVPLLTTSGHTVVRMTRGKRGGDGSSIVWDPESGQLDAHALEGFDAIIHLAGENIASRRWSTAQKVLIRDSRVVGTNLLSKTLAELKHKPKTLLCASAIGYYGNRGDKICTEQSTPGDDFLAHVCRDWEQATESAAEAGIRVVNMRIGVVLTPAGGALGKMQLPFKLGVGGVIGNGKQYMSCVAIDDVAGAIQHCLIHEELRGPVNLVAPEAVTNRDFTKTLGRILGRPTFFPMPAFAAKLAFGEMADALLLSSTRVVPNQLLNSGYQFRCPTVEEALRHVLGRK